MKMKKLWRSRKALSPVIAAIILIAVTVAVSIAVAAWMGALTFTFMGYEDISITEVTWNWTELPGSRTIDIVISNTGTKDVTVNHVEINYQAILSENVTMTMPFSFATSDPAQPFTITYPYTNGIGYDISVVTSGGYKFTYHFTGGQDTP